MSDKKETTQIEWRGIPVEITLTPNWLNGTAHHLELRTNQPLPMTQTGYRSHFFSASEDVDIVQAQVFVIDWLERDAQSKAWKDAEEARRQGDLFDL